LHSHRRVNEMDWIDVGKKIAATGAGLLGSAIAGPAGAGLGSIVADVLGVENRPDEIALAIERDPQAAVKLQEVQSQERVRLQEIASAQVLAEIQASTARQQTVNETMRAELKHDGWFKSGWRPFIGWVFGICITFLIVAMVYAI